MMTIWGTQIGGYNEHNSQFPPPPTVFIPLGEALQSAKTVDGAELEAMLQKGFDDQPSPTSPSYTRYQLSDGETKQLPNEGGYTPLSQSSSPSPIHMTRELPVNSQPQPGNQGGSHTGRYGPLGPLDPSLKF